MSYPELLHEVSAAHGRDAVPAEVQLGEGGRSAGGEAIGGDARQVVVGEI